MKCIGIFTMFLTIAAGLAATLGQDSSGSNKQEGLNWLVRSLGQWDDAKDPAVRDKLQAEIRRRQPEVDPAALVQALPPRLLDTFVGMQALEDWGNLDRPAALTWLSTHRDLTDDQLAVVTRGWVRLEPEKTRQYIKALPVSAWKNRVLGAVAMNAIMSDRNPEAITFIEQMEPGEQHARLLGMAASKWAQSSLKEAGNWAENIPVLTLKKEMLTRVALGHAVKNPSASADWLMQCSLEAEDRDRCLLAIVEMWVIDSTPESAAEWISKLPDDRTRQNAVAKLVAAWKEKAPEQMLMWLADQPKSLLRDQMLECLGGNKQS